MCLGGQFVRHGPAIRPRPPPLPGSLSHAAGGYRRGVAPPRAPVDSLDGAAAGSRVPLSPGDAHHLARVRRLGEGDAIEVFDPQGRTAAATLVRDGDAWHVRLTNNPQAAPANSAARLTVAAAVPKGQRAEWMVEKLAELGVGRLVPLIAARSVVEPGGGKLDRWRRVAGAAAKQSRATPITLDSPVRLADALADLPQPAVALATEVEAETLATMHDVVTLLVGPEGGWTPAELDGFRAAGCRFATLGPTVLRIETAAVCSAAVAASVAR